MFYLGYLGRHRPDAACAASAGPGRSRITARTSRSGAGGCSSTSWRWRTARWSRSTSPGRATRSTTRSASRTGTGSGSPFLFIGAIVIIGSIYYFVVQAQEAPRGARGAPRGRSRTFRRREGTQCHDRRRRVRLCDRRRRHRRLRRRRPLVGGPERLGLPDRGRPLRRRRSERSCGSRIGCTCSTRATTGTT